MAAELSPRMSIYTCHDFLPFTGIQIIDPQLKLISVIQHFTWHVEAKHGLPLFPAGITVDPCTKAMVMNGRTGHIQFYSPRTTTLLYNVSVLFYLCYV
jgi:NET1-associated nuclear protein 1 (U3 small nucleolar RNA-associated protein 17)